MMDLNGLPPIIDREILFGNPQISGGKISPNGKYISFIKPYQDIMNIWVKERQAEFETAIPITADLTRPIRSYFWSRDGRYLLYVQDKGGDENFHVYAVDPTAEKDPSTGVPPSRNLTDYDQVRAFILSISKINSDLLFVGLNDRDKSWHDLYSLNISTGERKLILENTENFSGFNLDLEDQLKLVSKSDENGGTIYYKITEEGYQECFTHTVDESCYPIRSIPGENKFYFGSNKGQADLIQLGILDLDNNEYKLVEKDPENQVDLGEVLFSDLSNQMIYTQYTGDKIRKYWKDKSFEADHQILNERFPDAEINLTSMTKNEELWLVYINSDTDPGSAYVFNRVDKKIDFLYRPRPDLPVEYLANMQPVRYPSSDGLSISAYLTLPKGVSPKNLPAVIVPHGGPWARDHWGYNSFAQFLANRGYAVLQPNFRGSTGFGKAFLNAGNNQWGELMQDDLTQGAQYLIDKGYADKNRIGIMGGSYGGYATLAGLAFTPEVYAAGVSIVGPSNLFTLLDTIPPYWESFRKVFHKRMGNPETEEGKEQMKRQSPFFHAQKITAPLLVAQGNNDPRVKTAESNQIVVALRDLGLPVEYINFMDEGHGFANPQNNIAFLAVAEKFLAKHLQGRCQENTSEQIQDIIENVTVDIKGVEI